VEALIAAIVADPEAIEHWMAYGDWLLERGDRRGEWIDAIARWIEGARSKP